MEFATAGDAVQIRWDDTAKTYDVKMPGSEWAALVPATSGSYDLTSDGTVIGHGYVSAWTHDYSYTRVLYTYPSDPDVAGYRTVFGVPTAASDMPVTGTATYLGELAGGDGYWFGIGGDATFAFDFGAGTLSGHLNPYYDDGWYYVSLGQYDFVNTVYSTGSTSFSGDLLNSENALGGLFSGSFNGPGAAELMGQWQLQFPDVYGADGTTSTASGVVLAKKQ